MKLNSLKSNLSANLIKGVLVLLPFGIGILMGLVLIYGVGKLSDYFIADRFKEWIERFIKSIPILGSVFGTISVYGGWGLHGFST